MMWGRVISQKRDADGNPMGRAHSNPILDTRVYNVEFDDGNVTELTTNLIAESMYSQCDPDGNQYLLLDQLMDHRSDDQMTERWLYLTKSYTVRTERLIDARRRLDGNSAANGWTALPHGRPCETLRSLTRSKLLNMLRHTK